jgi:hypothetical protein
MRPQLFSGRAATRSPSLRPVSVACLALIAAAAAAAIFADAAATDSVAASASNSKDAQQRRRRTWMRKQNVPLDEMYVRLRYGSTGQDSFPCTAEVATLASDGIRNCLDSLMGPLCGMPSPIVSLGAASCSSGAGALVVVDGGRVDFLASDSKPSEDAVYECIPKVVESEQCLPLLRQSLGGSLFQVRVQASSRYTIEPTSFPTLPPSTSPPTRFPAEATEAPTVVPTAGSTEVPTEGATTGSPTFAPSDAPSISPSLRPTTTPPVSTAPTLVPVTEDTSIPTATTSSPTPVEAGPIPSDAVSEETSNNSRSGPGGGNATTPMVIGVVIGSLLLLALLVGLERERRRKRQNEDEDGDGDDDNATTRARGSQGSTTEATSPSKAGAAAATATAAASAGLWMAWMGKRGRRDPKDAPAASKRALPLAAEEWDDTGSVMEDGSYRGDLRLMAMVEVGQEEEEEDEEERGSYGNGKTVAGAPPTGNQNSPASTARTGALSSSSSTASGADTDKTNNDHDNEDDGSIETEQAIGAAAATSCPQPACFAGDACAKTTFASLFGYYRGLASPSSSSSSSTKQPLVDGSREVADTAAPIAVEELPAEFEQDRSWNPDDNSVGSREAADPSTDLFQPCSPATAMADDQSSLVALASQNSGTGAGTGTGTWGGAAVPGVLSYRTMPVEITPNEDLIDVPLRPVTFRAADTVAL